MIPQIQPWIDDSEWQEVKKIIESTYLSENKVTAQFKPDLKTLTGEADLVFVVQTTMCDRNFQSGEWEEHGAYSFGKYRQSK